MSVANSLVRNFLLVTLGYNQVEDVFWLLVVGCWLLFAGCWLFGWLGFVGFVLVVVVAGVGRHQDGIPINPYEPSHNLPTKGGTSQYIWAYIFLGLIPRLR